MQDKRANWIQDDRSPSQDDVIVDKIKDQLEEKMQESAMDINVFCKDGYVHLSGIVDVLSEKIKSEDIVRSIDGVRKIENKITVAMDSNITDKHMEKEIVSRLRKNEALNGVNTKVNDGVSNLIGSTRTLKEAKEACSLASKTRGIKDVVNNIKIESYGEYDDSTISSKVGTALGKTDLSLMDIGHNVKNGKLTLSGFVNSRQEIELAKEIAMEVEGVRKVINKLKIRRDNQKQI
ncbi:BON domain-containing protein [Paramaledivibacter caminithermalis]|uniref:Osmotically-inducible protein OsmY, contains BON domain n=1 Tax=Paramaledivibacter caminithermalis (strain DSM 15212 / CIP 107654 / DViRD3) TaxID=1121301 RepID=A0A1M6QDI8_PARC5|nr:BON domain-containing protein [Paramaledivibacter caminithermalis]SHK18180.1 Osmotically-inducible protein OsmY, contains BON domain [Paramaledivibacter caminithermalis DSM 15212]